MVDVISPETTQVLYSVESIYGDGGETSGCPPVKSFKWIGIIEDVLNGYDNSLMEARGIGSIDINALMSGMVNPEVSLKWLVQKAYDTFDPATMFGYAKTFPVGLGLAYEATFGSTPSYFSLWYKGMQMDSLEIDFEVDSFIKASAKFIGQDIASSNALITSSSRETNPLDLTNARALPLTGLDAEVFMNVDGAEDVPITNVKRVHLYVRNHLVKIPVVQTSNPELLKYILKGRRELGGEITVYVENKTQLDYLLDAELLDIRIDLEKSGNTPYFDFSDAKVDAGGLSTRLNEVPCELTLPFKAASIDIG